MPRRRRQTSSANVDKNKLYLEIAGIVIAALVLVYTASSYYLEKVANNPNVSILENIARTPTDEIIEGTNRELLHRVYCNYYIRLSNQGGADAVVKETVARIRYKDRQEDLVVNDLTGWSNMIEDLLLTVYYNPYFPEIPKIPGRSHRSNIPYS